VYLPIDVSAEALRAAQQLVEHLIAKVSVRPFVGHHDEAFSAVRAIGPRRLTLFIGSSVGNYEDDEAVELLGQLRGSLLTGGVLLLGTDFKKDPTELVRACDDAAGVTAAFNRNVLARINRELGGHFDLEKFRHVAIWNEDTSAVEMRLESTCAQEVAVDGLGQNVSFRPGERIHTESSIKYDLPRVDALLRRSGFARETTYFDEHERFAVHLARAV
jgi:dimethylhistidine N-methyltransferase